MMIHRKYEKGIPTKKTITLIEIKLQILSHGYLYIFLPYFTILINPLNVVKFNHHWSSFSNIKIINSYAYQQMQKFWILLDEEHSAKGSKYEKNSTDYHQPSPDKKVCTKRLMNHRHDTENKVNLLVREHGVISKCCTLCNESNSNKLQRQLKVLVCYYELYTINHLLCKC